MTNSDAGQQGSSGLPAVVGLIPAAGFGSRLGPLPCSKELLPVGLQVREDGGSIRPKVVSEYLLDQMVRAGCNPVFFVLRHGKWDIPAYFGSGTGRATDIGYLLVDEPYGPPFTLGQAAPFVRGAIVAVGFPDMLLHPPDVLADVVRALKATPQADIMLGTLPAQDRSGTDLVRPGGDDRIAALIPKEQAPEWQDSDCTWAVAAWRPRFTGFLVQELARLRAVARAQTDGVTPEWPVGTVIAAALDAGLDVRRTHFDDAVYLDIGLPERLAQATDFPGVWDGR